MAYPGSFHRLVLVGTAYGDIWNTSLSIVPTQPTPVNEPTDDLVLKVQTAVQTWWTDGTTNGYKPPSTHKLERIKLNRIGADGRYVDGTTHEHIYTAPLVGPGSGTPAGQLASVLTIRTAVDRGRASKGRMFLPPAEGFTVVGTTDGLVSVAVATRLATAGRALVIALNSAYDTAAGGFSEGVVGVASNVGSGTFRPCTGVSVGRAPDTMRSRRSKVRESPIELAL